MIPPQSLSVSEVVDLFDRGIVAASEVREYLGISSGGSKVEFSIKGIADAVSAELVKRAKRDPNVFGTL